VTVSQSGTIVILNGAPRSGKSAIVTAVQESFDGLWMNLGVDVWMRATPERYRPGISLRPGGERPDLEPAVRQIYAGLYGSIAAHARQGINVIAEFGHHDWYATPLGILPDSAHRLAGLPVLFVGVRCPIDVIMARRNAGQSDNAVTYETGTADFPVPAVVHRFQDAVHVPGIYDMEVDTSVLSPPECAALIHERLTNGIPSPSAFGRLRLFQSTES
jgi:chloramphenicol 3-O phosphotransferase